MAQCNSTIGDFATNANRILEYVRIITSNLDNQIKSIDCATFRSTDSASFRLKSVHNKNRSELPYAQKKSAFMNKQPLREHIILFPEGALSGYPVFDLIELTHFVKTQQHVLKNLIKI